VGRPTIGKRRGNEGDNDETSGDVCALHVILPYRGPLLERKYHLAWTDSNNGRNTEGTAVGMNVDEPTIGKCEDGARGNDGR
jgi:hypothetical protein